MNLGFTFTKAPLAPWPGYLCNLTGKRDDTKRRKLRKGPNVSLAAQGGIAILSPRHQHHAKDQAAGKARAHKDTAPGEHRAVGKVRLVHYAELLTLLPTFEVGGHRGLLHLL